MSAQLASELLKLRTTRAFLAFGLVAVGLAFFSALAQGLSATLDELAQEDTQRTFLAGSATNAAFIATFVGLLAATNEFRYGTIRPTLLVEPRRRVVLGAKLATAALVGLALGVMCVAASFGVGLSILAARDVDLALTDAQTFVLVIGPIVTSALSAMVGLTVGALIRNQVGAIVAVAAYSFTVDALLFYTVPSIGRFLPGQAGNALSGMPEEHLLAPGAAAAVMLAWTLAFVAVATVRTDRSDV